MLSFLTSQDVTKYIAACASKAGVSIVWEDPRSCTPRTSGTTMYLPMIGTSASPKDIIRLKQFVKHETSHIKYTDFSAVDGVKQASLLMLIANVIEDHRIDYLNDRDYAGDRANTDAYSLVFMEQGMKDLTDEHRNTILPIFAWETGVRDDLWTVSMQEYMEKPVPAGNEPLRKLKAGDYSDVLRNIREITDKVAGTRAAVDLAKRIVKEVFEEDPEQHMEPPPAPEDKSGGEGDGEGEQDGEGDAGKAELSDEKGEGEESKVTVIDAKGRELTFSPMHTGAKEEGAQLLNYSAKGTGYTPTPKDQVREFLFEQGIKAPEFDGSPNPGVAREIEKLAASPTNMANILRTKLQVFSRDRMEYGVKRGKLQNSALWKTSIKGSPVQEKIFKRQIKNDTLDVAVQILLDCSGSMYLDKFIHGAAAVTLLNDVLSNVLNIPVEVLGYTEVYPKSGRYSAVGVGHECNAMYVFQSFGKRTSSPEMIRRMSVASNTLCNNADGEAFAYGMERLMQRREKRRIMIVLSDGQPADDGGKGDVCTYTHQVIEQIEKSPVELYGIGILHDGVDKWYKNYHVINRADEIEASLIKIVDKLILS